MTRFIVPLQVMIPISVLTAIIWLIMVAIYSDVADDIATVTVATATPSPNLLSDRMREELASNVIECREYTHLLIGNIDTRCKLVQKTR